MRRAAHPSSGMNSSNPRRWRGKRLRHHGDVVCHVVCAFCVAFDSCRMRPTYVLEVSHSEPPRLAPYLDRFGPLLQNFLFAPPSTTTLISTFQTKCHPNVHNITAISKSQRYPSLGESQLVSPSHTTFLWTLLSCTHSFHFHHHRTVSWSLLN
jgi:hypothetical protein